MKNIVLIVIGSLAGLYSIGALIQLIAVLATVKDRTTGYPPAKYIASAIVPLCLGLAVCLWCLSRAFRKPDTEDEEDKEDDMYDADKSRH